MNYSVVLIDDELYNIQGFSKYVHWNDLGFNLTNIFTDSREALEYLIKHSVDLIITDIEMPFINGFEIIRKIKQYHPTTETVVLTAYSEFEFIKTAMEYNCLSYILKTSSIDEFENKLLYIKKQLDATHQTRAMVTELAELKYYLKEIFVDNITNGIYNKATNINEQLPFKLCVSTDTCKAYMFKITNFDKEHMSRYDSESTYTIIYNLFNLNNIQNVEYLVSINDEITILALYDNDFPGLTNCSYLKNVLGANAVISNEKFFEDISSLFEYFSVTKNEYVLDKLITSFRSLIMEENFEYAGKKLNDIFDICEKCEISDYTTIFKNMFNSVENSDSINPNSLSTLKQFKETCTQFFSKHTNLSANQVKNNKILISEIIVYIKTNMDKDITLKEIAGKFFISYEYLSRLFKKQTGLNFKEFVVTLKIDHACDLLSQSNLTINAIANAVGFKDARYFSIIFKKYKGCLPIEYRTVIGDKNITE